MMRAMTAAGVLAIGGLFLLAAPTHAGCCGGGGGGGGGGYGWGRIGGGHTFNASYGGGYYGGYYGCGGGCGMMMSGMSMGGGAMPGMNMTSPVATQAPAATAVPAPASTATQYYCPMHPNVMSTFPAICPYCQMALKAR